MSEKLPVFCLFFVMYMVLLCNSCSGQIKGYLNGFSSVFFYVFHPRCTPCGCWARTSHLRSSWAWVTTCAQCSHSTTAASAPTLTSACRAKTAPTTGLRSFSIEVESLTRSQSPVFSLLSTSLSLGAGFCRHLSRVSACLFLKDCRAVANIWNPECQRSHGWTDFEIWQYLRGNK